MKSLYKSALGLLVATAAGLTVWSAAAGRQALSSPLSPSASELESAAQTLVAAQALVAPAATALPPAPAPEAAAAATPVPVPADLKATVRASRNGRVLTVRRQGHLVAVRQGNERRVAMNQVEWTPRPGDSAALTWETTHAGTLDTVSGRLAWSGDDSAVSIESAAAPAVLTAEAAAAHLCRGHADGAGGFVVLCRVDAPAAAASIEGKDPRDGVWSLAGEHTLVRFDLPLAAEGTNTKVLGYEKARKGVVVRIEASRVQGEPAALLAIGSDSRRQPEPVRPRTFCCRIF